MSNMHFDFTLDMYLTSDYSQADFLKVRDLDLLEKDTTERTNSLSWIESDPGCSLESIHHLWGIRKKRIPEFQTPTLSQKNSDYITKA